MPKRLLLAFLAFAPLLAIAGTVTGVVSTATSGAVKNGTVNFTLSQNAVSPGSFLAVSTPVNCYTDSSGNVVGVPDPLALPIVSANLAAGTLPPGTYFITIAYYTGATLTAVSPELQFVMFGPGTLIVTPPVIQPLSATGYKVYISTASGTETLQGTATSFVNFNQSVPLVVGAAMPGGNNTVCTIVFNDAMIPYPTYYLTSISDKNASKLSGFPQKWFLSGSSINISLGTPVFQGATIYPTAIISGPSSNAMQSISGPLDLRPYRIFAFGIHFGDGTVQDTAAANSFVGTLNRLLRSNGAGSFTDSSVTDTAGTTNILSTTDLTLKVPSNAVMCFSTDTCWSRKSAGLMGAGSGAQGAVDGSVQATSVIFTGDNSTQTTAFIAPLGTGQGGTGFTDTTYSGNTHELATFTGAATASKCIHTDASGNLKVAAADCAAAGMTNPMTTAGDIIDSADGAGTPERIAIGGVGLPLSVNSAGTHPQWGVPASFTSLTTSASIARTNLITAAPAGEYFPYTSLITTGACSDGFSGAVKLFIFWTNDSGQVPAFGTYNPDYSVTGLGNAGNWEFCTSTTAANVIGTDGCSLGFRVAYDLAVKNATNISYQTFYLGCSTGQYTCAGGGVQNCQAFGISTGNPTCTAGGVPTCAGGGTPACVKSGISNSLPNDGFTYTPICQTGGTFNYAVRVGLQRLF